jgi:hypothetical protein
MEWKDYTEQIKNNALNPIFKKRKPMHIKYTSDELTFILLEIQNAGVGIIPL